MEARRLLSLLCVLQTWQQALGIMLSSSQSSILGTINSGAYSTNHFDLMITHLAMVNAKVRITYPEDFLAANLGVDVCVGYLTTSSSRVKVLCTVTGNAVTWYLGTVTSVSFTLSVDHVRNPPVSGGTGNFKAELLSDEYVIEENNALGTVGITDPPVTLTTSTVTPPATIVEVSSQPAVINAFQTYTFRLTSPIDLPAATRLRITFPRTFNLTSPLTCSASTGILQPCRRQDSESNIVIVPGISSLVRANTALTASVAGVRNPSETGVTGYFLVECLQNNTNTQLAISTHIDGPNVSPGPITVKSILASGLKQVHSAEYPLQFSTTKSS